MGEEGRRNGVKGGGEGRRNGGGEGEGGMEGERGKEEDSDGRKPWTITTT